jgi:hypothetical protein
VVFHDAKYYASHQHGIFTSQRSTQGWVPAQWRAGMARSDSEQQLEQLKQLRQQLDQLEDERRRAAAPPPPPGAMANAAKSPETEPPDIPEELSGWIHPDGEVDAEAILDSLKSSTSNWLETINEDLKDTKPATILLVFGLGVMVGRLTA